MKTRCVSCNNARLAIMQEVCYYPYILFPQLAVLLFEQCESYEHMQTKNFSIKKAFSFGFKKVFEHIGLIVSAELLLFGLWLVLPIMTFAIAILSGPSDSVNSLALLDTLSQYVQALIPPSIRTILICILGPAIIAVAFSLLTFVQGLRRITLDIYDQNASSPQRIASQIATIITLCIANFLYGAMVQLGLVLLILPGLYLSAKYGFYNYCLVDDNSLGPIEAFKKSSQLTRGVVDYLCLYNILWLLLAWLSFIFIITWIIVIPALFLADAYIYRQLTQETPMCNETINKNMY